MMLIGAIAAGTVGFMIFVIYLNIRTIRFFKVRAALRRRVAPAGADPPRTRQMLGIDQSDEARSARATRIEALQEKQKKSEAGDDT
jgi:hypothetical protein